MHYSLKTKDKAYTMIYIAWKEENRILKRKSISFWVIPQDLSGAKWREANCVCMQLTPNLFFMTSLCIVLDLIWIADQCFRYEEDPKKRYKSLTKKYNAFIHHVKHLPLNTIIWTRISILICIDSMVSPAINF